MRNSWTERRDKRQIKTIQDYLDQIVHYGTVIPNHIVNGHKVTLHFHHWLPKKNAVSLASISRENGKWFIGSPTFSSYRAALPRYGTQDFWSMIETIIKRRVKHIQDLNMKKTQHANNMSATRTKGPKRKYKR